MADTKGSAHDQDLYGKNLNTMTDKELVEWAFLLMGDLHGWKNGEVSLACGYHSRTGLSNLLYGTTARLPKRKRKRIIELVRLADKHHKLSAPKVPFSISVPLAEVLVANGKRPEAPPATPPQEAPSGGDLLAVLDQCRTDTERARKRLQAKLDAGVPPLVAVGVQEALRLYEQLTPLLTLR